VISKSSHNFKTTWFECKVDTFLKKKNKFFLQKIHK
jgi:hypothetical protein